MNTEQGAQPLAVAQAMERVQADAMDDDEIQDILWPDYRVRSMLK